MLIYRIGNIFDFEGQTIVNPVNCVGVMGAGLALQFKVRYPDMFPLYKKYCDEGLLVPGNLWIWKGVDKWVLNFPTKDHWKNPSNYEFIKSGLDKFRNTYKDQGIESIAFPLLGAGLGHLVKDDIKLLFKQYLSQCEIPTVVYEINSEV